MAKIGEINCGTLQRNTGWGRCAWEPKQIIGTIFVPRGTSIVNADITDIDDHIDDRIHDDNPYTRWYLVPLHVGIETANTDRPTATFGYGGSEPSGVAYVGWNLRWRDGKFCTFKGMRSFNDRQDIYSIFHVDKSGKLLGYEEEVNGVLTLYPFDLLSVYTPDWIPDTGSDVPSYTVQLRYADNTQMSDKLSAIETGLSYGRLSGISDVLVSLFSSVTSGVLQVTATEACGGTNMGDIYATQLAAVAAWRVYNNTTGNLVTISTVTYNPLTKRFIIDQDATDPDFTTVALNTRVQLAPPQALSALGVEWYESNKLLVTSVA